MPTEIINPITNSDIHHFAVEHGVKLYEIADFMRIDDVDFFKELESEMPDSRKDRIKKVITAIERANAYEARRADT